MAVSRGVSRGTKRTLSVPASDSTFRPPRTTSTAARGLGSHQAQVTSPLTTRPSTALATRQRLTTSMLHSRRSSIICRCSLTQSPRVRETRAKVQGRALFGSRMGTGSGWSSIPPTTRWRRSARSQRGGRVVPESLLTTGNGHRQSVHSPGQAKIKRKWCLQ